MNFKTKISKLHYDKKAKGLFVDLLEFLSLFYGFITRWRNELYDKNILKSVKINTKVISIGNLTTGGVGKTPIAAALARYFINKNEKTAIISGGYGGTLSNKNINVISDGKKIYYDALQAGDEVYWHAINNPSSVVLSSKDRAKAAKYAVDTFGCRVIILDDAFQHRHIYRDIDIVLVDSELGFGNEKLLPAGPLREGKEALKRIDKLVMVNKGQDITKTEKLSKIYTKKLGCPTYVCHIEPDYAYNIVSGERLADGEAVTAICGIGQPDSFFDFVERKFEIIKKISCDDHHIYKKDEVEHIKGIIITTEKDAVKLLRFKNKNIYALKLKIDLDINAILAK